MNENEKETRTFEVSELRAVGDGGEQKITGYAAVFGLLSEDLGGFREKIAQGAFSKSLSRGADVRALWNHNPDYILGRTKSGTLRLSEDTRGLAIEIDPPDTSYARDLVESIKRGDVDQMSFGFRAIGQEWTHEPGASIRTLTEVELYDVSPVTYPAYQQTSAQVRAYLSEVNRQKTDNEQPNTEPGGEVEAVKQAQARHANRRRRISLKTTIGD